MYTNYQRMKKLFQIIDVPFLDDQEDDWLCMVIFLVVPTHQPMPMLKE